MTTKEEIENSFEQRVAVYECVRRFGMESVLSELLNYINFISQGESYLGRLSHDLRRTLEHYQERNQDDDE